MIDKRAIIKIAKVSILSVIILSLFSFIFLYTSFVSSDAPTKINLNSIYDSPNQEISIKSLSNIDIVKLKLDTPIQNNVIPSSSSTIAELDITNYTDANIKVNGIILYNLNNNNKKIYRNITYWKLAKTILEQRNFTTVSCYNLDQNYNCTLHPFEPLCRLDNCTTETHSYYSPIETLVQTEDLSGKIKIKSDTYEGDNIEWILNVV
jgi:hypothetical protein